MSFDKSLHMWLVRTLPLNNLASNVFSHMWSDLLSDTSHSVKALLPTTTYYRFAMAMVSSVQLRL